MRKIRNAIFKYRNQDNCYNMLKIQCAEQIDRLDKTDRQTDRQRAQRHLVIINGRKEIQNLTYE